MVLRYLAWTPLAAIALAVTVLGIVQNARYGAWLDAASGGETVAVLGIALGGFGITFGVLNAFKVLSLPAIILAWHQGHRVIAATCAVGFIGLACLSIWNVTALQTIARDDKGARHEVERQRLAGIKAELAEVEVRSKALGEARLTGEIESNLAAMRVDRRWSSSNECRDATAPASRTFCADYHREFAELTRANEIEQLRMKAERLSGEVAKRTTVSALQRVEPELQKLAEATGLSGSSIGSWRAIVFAMTFELVEAFALALAWVVRPRAAGSQGNLPALQDDDLGMPTMASAPRTCPEVDTHASAHAPQVIEPAPELAPNTAKTGAYASVSVATKPAPRPGLRLVGSAPAMSAKPALGPEGAIEPAQAVAAFVATLARSPSTRATSGQLFDAYQVERPARGWPELTATAFGRNLKTVVTKAGGRKIKSNGQQVYVGFAIPSAMTSGAA